MENNSEQGWAGQNFPFAQRREGRDKRENKPTKGVLLRARRVLASSMGDRARNEKERVVAELLGS